MIYLFVVKLLILKAFNINSIFQSFCNASGQTPNLSKSHILFSKNVDEDSTVMNIFCVAALAPNTTYLGQPLIFNHSDRIKLTTSF